MQQGYINQFLFKGSGLKHLQKPEFKNLKIPLPPLEIQKQIVSECESLESRCNTIEQSIRAYQELIKAILWHCGITTESTKDFDSILMSLAELESKLDFELLGKTKQDSKAFLQNLTNILNTLPTPPSNGWERIWLKDTRFIDLNPKKEINNYDENMLVSFVEMASVSDKGYIERKINKPLKEVKKGYTYFIENDVLIAKITPCMENGKCAIATNLTNNIGFGSTEFHIFRAKSGLKPNFLFYNLNQEAIREQAAIAMTGASGHKRVPISFYENLTIPLPPLEAQEKITQSIETIQSQISFLDSALPLLQSQKQEVLKNTFFKHF
nr:restriction endonuclease subunit S [Helicobacter sp. 11-8110]